jgi:hypothetical protein
MKILKTSLLVTLLLLTPQSVFAQKRRSVSNTSSASAAATRSNGPTVDSQTGNTILCKGLPLPEGFVIAGEMFSDSCQASAWIIKQKSGPPLDLERFNARTDAFANLRHSPAGVVEPHEIITPGQCDSFQQTIKGIYNFKPALMNELQVKAQSEKLDVFWNQVRQSRATLLPCLRQALKQDRSGSFFAIDGSMLLVDVDPSGASKALQVRKFIEADLDGTDLEYWVATARAVAWKVSTPRKRERSGLLIRRQSTSSRCTEISLSGLLSAQFSFSAAWMKIWRRRCCCASRMMSDIRIATTLLRSCRAWLLPLLTAH